MSTQTYDIEEVKEYFFYHIYRGRTRNMTEDQYKSYTGGNYFLLSEKIGGIIITLLMMIFMSGSLLIVLFNGVYLLIDAIQTYSILLVIITFCSLFMYYGFNMSYLAHKFSRIQRYFSLKSSLTPFLEKFERNTKRDIFSDGVDAVEVDEIRKNMEDISALISLLSGPLIQFRRIGTSLPDEAKLVLEKFISLEVEWITETVKDFRISLSLWLGVHASELSAYEKEKLQSANESLYSLSRTRLEAHREDIEKVRINF